MTVDFVRFKAADGVELQGWLSDPGGDTAAVHIHGMSGNGYENRFLDDLRTMYNEAGIAFFAIDTRGAGIINDFRQGDGTKHAGSCFEIFEESVHDIDGALAHLRDEGKTKFILQGHSLGGSKVVHYLTSGDRPDVTGAVLLAPTYMVGWAATDPSNDEYLAKAKELVAAGQGEELVRAQCWLDKTPISAQTYVACAPGSAADIYHGDPAAISRLVQPTLIVYGDQDIGITEIDGTVAKWQERVEQVKHANTEIAVIPGANHGYRGYETELATSLSAFLVSLQSNGRASR